MAGNLLMIDIGSKLSDRKTWERLIHEWVAVLNQYLEWEESDDIPQWHDERSHTGFFAGAVWKLGGVALEEFSTERSKGKGRCDLYFSLDEIVCLMEAKRTWPANAEYLTDIQRKLKSAGEQLDTIQRKDRKGIKQCMAFCWVIPRLSDDSGGEDFGEEVLSNISRAFAGAESLIAAYHVPAKERKSCEKEYGDGYTYPGIILIGQLWHAK